MKRLTIVFSVLFVFGMLLAACSPAATATVAPVTAATAAPVVTAAATAAPVTEFPRNETFYMTGAAWGPASTWNPVTGGGMLANSTGTVGLLYETLFGFNPLTGATTPMLAKTGTWTNATTFDVTLQAGTVWSDGQPLTADDVVFTYKLGQTYSDVPYSVIWKYLTDVKAVDSTHVEFTFTNPLYQEFAYYLYNVAIVPQHIWGSFDKATILTGANTNPIGSGAYLFYSSDADRNVWQRNDKWWGIPVFGTPGPKWLVEVHTSGNNVALGMVLKGELDLSNNFLPGVGTLVSQGYVKSYYPKAPYMLSANTAVLFMNLTMKPLDDPAFRKALAYSINTADIVNIAYAGLVNVASPTGLLPALNQFVDQSTVASLGFSYDPAKAKALLAAAGYKAGSDGFVTNKDGSPIALHVTCPNGWTDWMAAIDVIATSAQAVGINLTTSLPSQSDWTTAMQTGTFELTLNNNTGLSNTPWTLYNTLFYHPIIPTMSVGNFERYNNQAMFDAVDALAKLSLTDTAAMQAATKQIQQIMLTDVPVIPLWYNGMWAQWSNSVWTGESTDGSAKQAVPSTWNGYWQTGGLDTLLNLTLTPAK